MGRISYFFTACISLPVATDVELGVELGLWIERPFRFGGDTISFHWVVNPGVVIRCFYL